MIIYMTQKELTNLKTHSSNQKIKKGGETIMGHDFEDVCFEYRKEIKEIAAKVKSLKRYAVVRTQPESTPGSNDSESGEIEANAVLAYRHLEDAAMRLGKAIQAYDGGVSIYDK